MSLFYKNIRLIRIIRGYSQDNLAGYINKSQNWVSAVESGKLCPTLKDKKAISDFLEMSLEDLENAQFTVVKAEALEAVNRLELLETELKKLKQTMSSIKNRLDY